MPTNVICNQAWFPSRAWPAPTRAVWLSGEELGEGGAQWLNGLGFPCVEVG